MRKITTMAFGWLFICATACLATFYSGGTGNLDSPFQLGTAEDIIALAENEGHWGAAFELAGDIDLGGIDFKPFTQDLQNGFGGTINGKGFTIKNLTIKGVKGRYVGLFGVLARTAVIRNLTLKDVDIIATTPEEIEKNRHLYVGSFAGVSKGGVLNCTATGRIRAAAGELVSVGGMFGRLENAMIDRCYSAVSIRAISTGQSYAGGFVGYCHSSYMLNNISKSNIYATGSSQTYAGAITGYALHTGFNSCCGKEGRVLVDCGGFAGGITGYSYNGQIINCYSLNDVYSFQKGYAGGIVAGNYNSIAQNCYFAGNLSLKEEKSRSGAIAGINSKSQILNCFWVYDTSLSNNAVAEGVFIGNVEVFSMQQIIAGGLFKDEIWNAETPKDALMPLWHLENGKLPQLNRTARAATSID